MIEQAKQIAERCGAQAKATALVERQRKWHLLQTRFPELAGWMLKQQELHCSLQALACWLSQRPSQTGSP